MFYHLDIDMNNWQTLYRVRGIVTKNGIPEPFMKFYWESNLFWDLGDTLGYYIHRGLTDDLEYVSYDTTYVTGFEGTLVPTSNTTSVSGEDGNVSNMIAPVKTMVGIIVQISSSLLFIVVLLIKCDLSKLCKFELHPRKNKIDKVT